MSSAWSQLEQMLTCAICLDKFKNPRLLPCQHSFCGDACMEGLVDYARRQIKCPECRAEHRIPYQGVASLPSNVTLIRFLELHSRITGEEPEPVPTFMEKCSVCGEKIEGVQRCWHCEKKVCPECKEAHLDLLRREILRLNNQSKRCFGKLKEFDETLDKAQERLNANKRSILNEIENSTKRLIEDLQAKQRKLCTEVEQFAEQEEKLLAKLKVSLKDELQVLESNLELADEKINNNGSSEKYPWTDRELNEMKEIYGRSMEFVRLFDPDVGDYTRKIRFSLIPEFDVMRRRICELGELKFAETGASLMASSFQYSNATGSVALEVCQAAAALAGQQGAQLSAGYGLAQSNSNSNLGGVSATMLELPSMQNALMRSQSDHRLASQFQQRLKQQQQQQQEASSGMSRFGVRADQELDSLRSRYAPPGRSAVKSDYANELLTRDWPRPTDNDSDSLPFGSSIQFKSAFMRRKEKERAGYSQNYSAAASQIDDDEDLASEASYGGASGRNVRFFDQQQVGADSRVAQSASAAPKLFDFREAERAPFSGVPRLDNAPHLLERLHQMGARAVVERKEQEEQGKRDKDLMESARMAITKASERAKAARQASEDEVERQKRANKQQETRERTSTLTSDQAPAQDQPEVPRPSADPVDVLANGSSTPVQSEQTSPLASSVPGGRRGLYGAAVTEKSRRQLSNAIQDAQATMIRRRSQAGADSGSDPNSPETSSIVATSRAKRTLRSGGRSMSRQSSTDNNDASASSTPRMSRRRLVRMDSSNQAPPAETDPSEPKNLSAGSVPASTTGESEGRTSSPTGQRATSYEPASPSAAPATLDSGHRDERPDTVEPQAGHTSQANSDSNRESSDEQDGLESERYSGQRNTGNRRSREFLPNAVNKLLDRSAQIRRDSQEARSRADSPQRAYTRDRPAYSARSHSRPLANYQRPDDEPVASNSNNSIYTTASSGSRGGLSSQRSTSTEEQAEQAGSTGRRLSGNSTDRTLTGAASGSASFRRDSGDSQHSSSGYQSRFLARSRTSAALSSSAGSSRAASLREHQDSQASTDEQPRSYLSSRERFMQSASVLGTSTSASRSSSGAHSAAANSSKAPGAHYYASYHTGPPTKHPLIQKYLYWPLRALSSPTSAAKPSYSPSSAYSKSYLPQATSRRYATSSSSKAARFTSGRRTSSNSSGNSTSYLARSRSGQLAFGRSHSNENSPSFSANSDDDDHDHDDNLASEHSSAAKTSSRRSSLAGLELGVAARYLSKGRMLFKLGSRGSEPASFTWPRGVAVGFGSGGREIVVADSSNHRVQVFDSNARFTNEFGTYGSGQAQFDCLAGVAINRVHRNYVVSDRYNHRIQVFDLSGGFVRAFGELGSEPGQFNLPWGVACDQSSGLIYVCDKENHRVQVFDIEGRHMSKFGQCGSQLGQLQHPHYIAVGQSSRVVVTDTNNHRVQVFDAQTGRVRSSFGKEGSSNGQFKFPRGVAMDDSGCIIVGDSGNNRLQIFSPDGVFVKSIGTWGSADGEFKGIEGVAVDSSNNNIFVCDRENHRIQVF